MKQRETSISHWSRQLDEIIKAEYSDRPTEGIARETGANYYTISRRAARLGIKKSEAFMHSSFVKGAKTKTGGSRKRRALAEGYLRAHFADTRNEEIADLFGVDVKTVRRWARRLGLVKDGGFMQKMREKGIKRRKFYTPEYVAWRNRRIAEVYPDADEEGLQHLADELGISIPFVRKLANRIGQVRSHKPPQYLDELAEYFPTHTDRECAERFGIPKPTVQGIARKYGWKKTAGHLQRIHDSNIAAAHVANAKKRGK